MGLKESIATNIRARRKASGLTQAQVAQKSGLSLRHISVLETTVDNVTIDTLGSIAKVFGCRVVDLVGDADAAPLRKKGRAKDAKALPKRAAYGLDEAIKLLRQARKKVDET